MYATKIGDDESNYFVSGRKRTNFNRTPENFKASVPTQIQPEKPKSDWMSQLKNFGNQKRENFVLKSYDRWLLEQNNKKER